MTDTIDEFIWAMAEVSFFSLTLFSASFFSLSETPGFDNTPCDAQDGLLDIAKVPATSSASITMRAPF
ncbi:MAG: hypothetical protein HOJ07_19230 [Rhodospirillaceae bacterium]|nr:hypothetical protein [Rhodospirillaceae bacterium]